MYEQCVLGADGGCTRWSHDHAPAPHAPWGTDPSGYCGCADCETTDEDVDHCSRNGHNPTDGDSDRCIRCGDQIICGKAEAWRKGAAAGHHSPLTWFALRQCNPYEVGE